MLQFGLWNCVLRNFDNIQLVVTSDSRNGVGLATNDRLSCSTLTANTCVESVGSWNNPEKLLDGVKNEVSERDTGVQPIRVICLIV